MALGPAPILIALVAAATPRADPNPPKGDYAAYESNYARLLEKHAARQGASEPPTPAAEARAGADTARVIVTEGEQIRASYDDASRMQVDCVVEATSYADLSACRVDSLPIFRDPSAAAKDAAPEAASVDDRLARDPAGTTRHWVATGRFE